ncbi:MAG TPA: hypothetical protein VHO24_03020 [Opitutaceae bacterium]|nr:hypothetical protein [Opitutaceae bacterium]
MSWIFDHLGTVIFWVMAFVIVRKVRAFLRRVESETQRRAGSRPAANYDPEEARRVREIQEEIRRKIAERRGGAQPTTRAPFGTPAENPPVLVPTHTPVPDPFESPMKKVLAELERRMQPPAPPVVPESRPSQTAQLERQEQLAEQMRVLEESRVLVQRRAAQARAAVTNESASERGMLTASRGSLLTELRDPRGLRRAFVLREILGAPVGLR